jgi:hypothetical protein
MRVPKFFSATFVAGAMACASIALALPSTACLGDLMCGDICSGQPICFHYSEAGCPKDGTCTLTVRCHCNGPCTYESQCQPHVNESECVADSVCAWGNACTANPDGCFHLDQARCSEVQGCKPERNCN